MRGGGPPDVVLPAVPAVLVDGVPAGVVVQPVQHGGGGAQPAAVWYVQAKTRLCPVRGDGRGLAMPVLQISVGHVGSPLCSVPVPRLCDLRAVQY